MTGMGFFVILAPLCIISSSFFHVCSFPCYFPLLTALKKSIPDQLENSLPRSTKKVLKGRLV